MKEIKKFNNTIFLIALLTYGIIGLVFYYIFPKYFHYSLLLVPILEAVVTSFLHRKLILSSNARPQKFINMFMAVPTIYFKQITSNLTRYPQLPVNSFVIPCRVRKGNKPKE